MQERAERVGLFFSEDPPSNPREGLVYVDKKNMWVRYDDRWIVISTTKSALDYYEQQMKEKECRSSKLDMVNTLIDLPY